MKLLASVLWFYLNDIVFSQTKLQRWNQRVYKKKSSYKKKKKGFQGVPAWAKKETGARIINIEESEIESPQHRNICSTNTAEPADVSGRKLAGKEIDSIVDINNSASIAPEQHHHKVKDKH